MAQNALNGDIRLFKKLHMYDANSNPSYVFIFERKTEQQNGTWDTKTEIEVYDCNGASIQNIQHANGYILQNQGFEFKKVIR